MNSALYALLVFCALPLIALYFLVMIISTGFWVYFRVTDGYNIKSARSWFKQLPKAPLILIATVIGYFARKYDW